MHEIDKLIIRRGPNHQKVLKGISNKLQGSVFDENKIFSPSNYTQIEDFEKRKAMLFPDMVSTTFHLYLSSEASKAPGHDAAHIIDVLGSAARIFEEFDKNGIPLKEVERLEVSLGLIAHDLGRYTEPYFYSGHKDHETYDPTDQMSQKNLELLIPLVIGRKIAKQVGIPQVLGKRILYDIASGSIARTGHMAADLIHQCDREQLGGTVMVPRLVVLGMGIYDMDFVFPPTQEMSSYAADLPNINKVPVDKLLTRFEFWMRNTYPPISQEGSIADQRRQVETAVILMLGLREMDAKMRIVFAPELGLVNPSKVSPMKKPLLPGVFDQAVKEYQQFLSSVNPDLYSDERARNLAYNLVSIEGSNIPPGLEQKLKERQTKSMFKVNYNRWLIMLYALQKRHQKRLQDIELLSVPRNGVTLAVRNIVLDNLVDREKRFNKIYPSSEIM